MTLYLCLGGYSGFSFNLDANGFRLSLGLLVIGASSYNLENSLVQAVNTISVITSENYILHAICKDRLPEEYSKIFPPVTKVDDHSELN